jgi:hypothetical protein
MSALTVVKLAFPKKCCYELIGYPEWWDFSKKPRKIIVGKAAMATSGQVLRPRRGLRFLLQI